MLCLMSLLRTIIGKVKSGYVAEDSETKIASYDVSFANTVLNYNRNELHVIRILRTVKHIALRSYHMNSASLHCITILQHLQLRA